MRRRIRRRSSSARRAARTPIGRTGKPEDLAKVIAYLVSPANTYMTGTAVDVSGGMIMR